MQGEKWGRAAGAAVGGGLDAQGAASLCQAIDTAYFEDEAGNVALDDVFAIDDELEIRKAGGDADLVVVAF